ncbi:AMP-binding protein [Amylibacter sp.]|nr:AMP-binding protein [Amylibacter sp.]
MSYKATYDAAKLNPEKFWMEAAEKVDWITPPSKALFDDNAPFYEWFSDAEVNTCFNAVDRHVIAGNGEQTAIIYDSPITGKKSKISYLELKEKTARLGGLLKSQGVEKGDRIIIYMPMIPEAIVAMLACARIGAIHSVVFGGFAANELATRIDDCTPKVILAGSCGVEPSGIIAYKPLIDAAIDIATHKPKKCIIYQREILHAELIEGRDLDWVKAQHGIIPAECEKMNGSDPAYILYTSGTTGQPKGVLRPIAGHIVALTWTMKNVYDVNPGEVFWAASDVGWIVGHSYICYAPLFNGNTTVVFEGKPIGTPDPGTFWRIIEEYNIKVLFTAPTAFRAIKRVDPQGEYIKKYNLSSLESLFLAGERADPDTIEWAKHHLKIPVIDHWWQTETGYAIASNPWGIEKLPIKLGSPTVAMPGYNIQILDEFGKELPNGNLGSIAIKLPLPPGTLSTIWNADHRYNKSYLDTFPGYYETGDAGYKDDDDYLYIMARTDDVMNVAGHRLSSGQMEEVLASHPDIAECAVIGAADALKGQLPIGIMCTNVDTEKSNEEIINECIKLVRTKIGPVAAFKIAIIVDRLPKTRSGKILRGTIVKIADGNPYKAPATIDDPKILEEITLALKNIGYPKL